MLQVVQFVQYKIRQNKYSPQTTNVTFDGSRNKKHLIVLSVILYNNQ